MKNITRATLRGRPLMPDCYRAYASKNEYVSDSVNVTGCYGLMSDRDNYLRRCVECGAFVHGDIVNRLHEMGVK